MIDNSKLIAEFCPRHLDGDTFIYTEMLDRGKRKGNNGNRLLKTFYHRSVDEFWEQVPVIKQLCDLSCIRACTRLAPKSYKRVGVTYTKMVVEAALTNNWAGMKSLYNRACGITSPEKKLWLFDIDVIDDKTKSFGDKLKEAGNLVATIPSKKGLHYITNPFDIRLIEIYYQELNIAEPERLNNEYISLHKDNPTNLYIPDGAD